MALILLINQAVLALETDKKIKEIEELLIFYPQKGEKEMKNFVNSKMLGVCDKYKINYLKGILEYKKSNTDTAIIYLQKALFYFKETSNTTYLAKSELLLGAITEKVGNIDQALLHYYNVIEITPTKRELGYAYIGIARCKRYLNGIKNDKNYELEKGVKILKSLNKIECTLFANYMHCILSPKSNKYKPTLLKIAEEYEKINIELNASGAYRALSLAYLKENKLNLAVHYANRAIPLTKTAYPSTSLAPSLYHIKAMVDNRRKNYLEAEKKLKYALYLSDSLTQNGIKPYIYKTMVNVDSAIGDNKSAQLYKELAKAYFKIRSKTKVNNQIKVKELSLLINFQKESLKQKNLQVTILVLTLAVIALTYTIRFIRKRNKYEQGIAVKRIKGMQNLLVDISKRFDAHKLESEEIKKILGYTDEGSTPYECFEDAYSDTIITFSKRFPKLAEGEIRYAIMIYIGLPTNVIAYIKNVHMDTVRKAKRRLREKLDLTKGADLQKYFYSRIEL